MIGLKTGCACCCCRWDFTDKSSGISYLVSKRDFFFVAAVVDDDGFSSISSRLRLIRKSIGVLLLLSVILEWKNKRMSEYENGEGESESTKKMNWATEKKNLLAYTLSFEIIGVSEWWMGRCRKREREKEQKRYLPNAAYIFLIDRNRQISMCAYIYIIWYE